MNSLRFGYDDDGDAPALTDDPPFPPDWNWQLSLLDDDVDTTYDFETEFVEWRACHPEVVSEWAAAGWKATAAFIWSWHGIVGVGEATAWMDAVLAAHGSARPSRRSTTENAAWHLSHAHGSSQWRRVGLTAIDQLKWQNLGSWVTWEHASFYSDAGLKPDDALQWSPFRGSHVDELRAFVSCGRGPADVALIRTARDRNETPFVDPIDSSLELQQLVTSPLTTNQIVQHLDAGINALEIMNLDGPIDSSALSLLAALRRGAARCGSHHDTSSF